jgi:predicted alpha/beta-hydrolase family hydrolase
MNAVTIPTFTGPVSGLAIVPPKARALLVLAHGAGAGMRHPFMESVADALAAESIATLRYQFPYMEQGKKRPDRPAIAMETVRAAVDHARKAYPGIPLLAGGKSFGGRMTSNTQADAVLQGIVGIVLFGFPLHAPKRPSDTRAEHLSRIALPMLFLQGERDALADLSLLRPVVDALGDRATLHVVPDADHSFKVPRRTGRTTEEIIGDLAATTARWIERVAPNRL